MTRAIIFVHYDRDNVIDDYVYYYLKELQKNASHLIFVSTAQLLEKDMNSLSHYCDKVIIRENLGYDFMSYKTGLNSFDYEAYDEVVICNDSVYGPLYPLKHIFEDMDSHPCDVWGITDNTDFYYHLQSYFIVFKKNVIKSSAFKSFWEQVKVLNDKDDIIQKYEIGLTKVLLDNGFSSSVYTKFQPTNIQKINIFLKKFTPSKIINKMTAILSGQDKLIRIGKVNTTHHFWKEILISGKVPFIKIELLRDNPMKMNINNFEHTIGQVSQYDTHLIKNHLARMRDTL